MWTKSEKYLMLGVGYSIWGCVIDVTGISLMLTIVGLVYFCISIYNQFKGEE